MDIFPSLIIIMLKANMLGVIQDMKIKTLLLQEVYSLLISDTELISNFTPLIYSIVKFQTF